MTRRRHPVQFHRLVLVTIHVIISDREGCIVVKCLVSLRQACVRWVDQGIFFRKIFRYNEGPHTCTPG